jgi:hypothetical protein
MPVVIAVAPALPLHKAGPYVAAAYIVFMAVILLYVTIMAVRLSRNQRELRELRRDLERHREREREPAGRSALDDDDVQAPLLPHA